MRIVTIGIDITELLLARCNRLFTTVCTELCLMDVITSLSMCDCMHD